MKQSLWYATIPGGEAMADVGLRADRFFDTLHREQGDNNVVVVTHGEYMWAIRYLLEFSDDKMWEIARTDRSQIIKNAMVLHYSRINPGDPKQIEPRMTWMRAICPWNEKYSINNGNWTEIKHLKFSDQELLGQVERFPRTLQT